MQQAKKVLFFRSLLVISLKPCGKEKLSIHCDIHITFDISFSPTGKFYIIFRRGQTLMEFFLHKSRYLKLGSATLQ